MMKTTKKVLAGILWLGRGTATTMGVAVMLAVVLGIGTTALAAVPGDPFKLGRNNTIDQLSTLIGSSSGALLRVNNNGSGPALDLRVEPGKAPMNVNSSTRVSGLNADKLDDQNANAFLGSEDKAADADKLDGQTANDFLAEGQIYRVSDVGETTSNFDFTIQVTMLCDPGDKVLGGGGVTFDSEDVLRVSEPVSQEGWRVLAEVSTDQRDVVVEAVCADFPPLR